MRGAGEVLHVDASSDAVPAVRRWVAQRLGGTTHEELAPDAELVASELVTNALLHGDPPVVVRVVVNAVVRIEVVDGSRTAPMKMLARPDAMTGRGLTLVAALSRDWGVEQRPDGKLVWSEIGPAANEAEPDVTDVDALLAAWDDEIRADDVERYVVSLGDVPTDLLLAAKSHVDNIVREFTLAAHGAESGRSGAIPVQLAELIETVVNRFSEPRQAIKRQALDAASRGADRTTLTLHLPAEAAEAGERYLQALDEADSYARAARLLTLETPPQHRIFRRWYVESLVAQLRAAADGQRLETETFERRLLREVAVAELARRASDRAARLQTVTSALASTLTAEDVGNVVVSEGVAALGASGGGLIVASESDRLRVTAAVGYEEVLIRRLQSETRQDRLPAAVALRTGEPVWLESREERDEEFPDLHELEPNTISMCAVPLQAGDRVLGALRFSFDVARLFDVDERRFVLTLAGQTAQALERAEALAAARTANDKLAFLAAASATLAESLDYRTTLANVTRLAVPRLADWCAVHIAEEGEIASLAVAHVDPEKVAFADHFQRRYPIDPDAPFGIANVIRSGRSELNAAFPDEVLVTAARDEEHLAAMRSLGIVSTVSVPLAARGRIFGALSMYYAESGRHYDSSDLALAEDLAHRAALAIDNANLFRALTERS